ncbi:Hypothetical predicted protein [Paramuricea clavata]|uniref:Uncharacterized protein n=1 Tax=Paramuricea clavata TaxID=317549 RepID=A0A6S7GFZ4_PARCT|nr:Hypothetical predicted protein [Paramuricea clavata]
MANLIPMGRSAWFSSTVQKSKVESWVEGGGCVEPDPFQADLLFSENNEAADIQRIFKSKEYLAGHLAVFHSDFVIPAAKQEVVSNMDLMNSVLFPWKELDELGITLVPCLGDNRTVNITNHQSLGRSERSSTSDRICTSTPKDSENQTISRKNATQDEVPKNTRRRKKRTAQQSMGGRSFEDCISESSPTPDKSVVAKTSQTKNNSGGDRNCGMFYHSLNFDITHLDDISIPRVRLMDFKPGVNGACHVEKRKTKLREKHTS